MAESQDQPSSPAEPPRHGCLTALMFIVGLAMLLPGLCVVITALTTLPSLIVVGIGGLTGQPPSDPYFWVILGGWGVFWLICIGIGWLGVKLIRNASQ